MIRDKKLIDSIDEYGRVVLSTDDVIESMLSGHDVGGVYLDNIEDREQYVSSCKEFAHTPREFKKCENISDTIEEYFENKSNKWLIPKKYLSIDLIDYLSQRCKTEREKERLVLELSEFINRDQEMIIYLMIYLVDVMRENNVVWGVGRGSSVACFVLYLIGINKVNPLDYDIDYREFFKEE